MARGDQRIQEAARRLIDAPHHDLRLQADVQLIDLLSATRIDHVSRVIDLIRDVVDASRHLYQTAVSNWVLGMSQPTQLEQVLLSRTRTGPFLLMCSGSGYRRQRALQAVQEIPTAACLALVIHRLNDWVKEVESEAQTTLKRVGPKLPRQTLVDCYALQLSASRWGRLSGRSLTILDQLFHPRIGDAEIVQKMLTDRSTRSLPILRHGLVTGIWDTDLPQIASQARNPIIRLLAARTLLRGEHTWNQGERHVRKLTPAISHDSILGHALTDPSTAIRYIGLQHFAARPNHALDRRNVLQRMLFDQSFAVSNCAAYWLRQLGSDPIDLIRRKFDEGDALPTSALCQLAAIATPEELDRLLTIADCEDGSRNWPLTFAIAKRQVRELEPEIIKAAIGSNIQDAKKAVKTLAALRRNLPYPIMQDLATRPMDFDERGVFRLVELLPPSATAVILLSLAVHGMTLSRLEPRIAQLTARSRRYWRPDPEEVVAMRHLLIQLPQATQSAFQTVEWMLDTAS